MNASVNHAHYNLDKIDPVLAARLGPNFENAHGPVFVGQGWSKRCGSDTYGGYVTVIKTNPKNGKTIAGLVNAVTRMHAHWTEGTEDCSMPEDQAPTEWVTQFGKNWYFCDGRGRRVPGAKCLYRWKGAYSYRDPSF